MNKALEKIIAEIEEYFRCVPIDFNDDSWRKSIPSEAGWYLIETNAPIEVLRSMGVPQYKAHIDIPKTIKSATALINIGAAIKQSGNKHYVVYNGEARNLNSRAREHVRGHEKTFCLGLVNYPALHRYNWHFCYVSVSSFESLKNADKPLRLAIEQGWRAKHGWPILCKK